MQNIESNNEILSLEKRYWTAMRDNDVEGMMALTDFPCVLATVRGSQAYGEEEFRKMCEQGKGMIKDFKLDEKSVEVRRLSPDTAVIAYKAECVFAMKGEEKSMAVVDSSTWIKRDGKWGCAMHTETEMPN